MGSSNDPVCASAASLIFFHPSGCGYHFLIRYFKQAKTAIGSIISWFASFS
jgi:hypothetical protein